LQDASVDWQLVEARDRWGGRILTKIVERQGYDLGPSWFWPGQARIDALVTELELGRFDQAHQGDAIYQDEHGDIHRGQGFASMQGSWRLKGGFGRLIDKLVSILPAERLHQNTAVSKISDNGGDAKSAIEVSTISGSVFTASEVVLAIPPRVASQLDYEPALTSKVIDAAQNISTWMAGHAKVVAIYRTPFWKETGLSGDAVSRCGPLAEIHDASPFEGGPYALFGFVGTPASYRGGNTELQKHTIAKQLGLLFGEQGANPDEVLFQDWAFAPHTAMKLDQLPLKSHPTYGRPDELKALWQDRLLFGSTEMGAQFGGFLEGAIEAADELAADLIKRQRSYL
jgi:monoamine oxidase